MQKKIIKIRNIETKEFTLEEMTIEEVIKSFENMVYKNAIETYYDVKNVQHNIDEVEDINVMGMMELIDCYESYDYKKGAFSTHLTLALDRLRKRVSRDLFAEKRVADKGVISFEGSLDEIDAFQEVNGELDEYLERAELSYDINNALNELNEEERKIACFLMQEIKTKKQFAQELGITRPTLDSRIANTKEKLLAILKGY